MVLLQTAVKPASAVSKVQAILANSKSKRAGLLLFTLKSQVRLAQRAGGAVDFSVIFKMLDDMIGVLKKEGKDDMTQKDFCVGELDKTEREKEAADDKLANVGASIEEITGELDSIAQGVADLTAGIQALDKDVAEATALRKKEHAEYAENVQMQETANEIVGKAKNRLQKFYNPSAYKAPPKKEMSMEEKLASGGASSLMQTEAAFGAPPGTDSGASGGATRLCERTCTNDTSEASGASKAASVCIREEAPPDASFSSMDISFFGGALYAE